MSTGCFRLPEADTGAAQGAVNQRGRLGHLHDHAFADDGHTLRHGLYLAHDVGREKDSGAIGLGLGDQAQHLMLHQRIQAQRRLVQQEQFGAVHQRLHNSAQSSNPPCSHARH
jgi:hypothetical protein